MHSGTHQQSTNKPVLGQTSVDVASLDVEELVPSLVGWSSGVRRLLGTLRCLGQSLRFWALPEGI